MNFVPEPHNTAEELRARADGRYGPADCFQWPQMYAIQARQAICIPRKECHPHPDPLSWAWFTPTRKDFVDDGRTNVDYGYLKRDQFQDLNALYDVVYKRYKPWKDARGDKAEAAGPLLGVLEHTLRVLAMEPLRFFEVVAMVAQAQRLFLDIYAFMDFVQVAAPRINNPSQVPQPLRADWMGCFTVDENTLRQMYLAGVPVWYERNNLTITSKTIIKELVSYKFPDDIIRSHFIQQGLTNPFKPIFNGEGGSERHIQTRIPYVCRSLSVAPQAESSVGKAPTQCKQRKAEARGESSGGKGLYSRPTNKGKGRAAAAPPAGKFDLSRSVDLIVDIVVAGPSSSRNKWEDLDVAEMPSPLVVWQGAMQRLGQPRLGNRNPLADPGYRFPEPALFLSPQSAEKRQKYIVNWLTIRWFWINRVNTDPPSTFPKPQFWRDVLNTSDSEEKTDKVATGSTARKSNAIQIVGEECKIIMQDKGSNHLVWRDQLYTAESFLNPPPRIVRCILWEIFELSFAFELRALDQVLLPHIWKNHSRDRSAHLDGLYPTVAGKRLWEQDVPRRWGNLGLTDAVEDNRDFLMRWCLLLSTWPDSPPALGGRPKVGATAQEIQAHESDLMARACFFYVQTFFAQFGRPPIVPHRFPAECMP